MKLTIDPLPMMKSALKMRVNSGFASEAREEAHLSIAYTQKRAWAVEKNYEALRGEAELRGITSQELAKVILSKPDLVAERELRRQKIMKRIDNAVTMVELESIQNGK